MDNEKKMDVQGLIEKGKSQGSLSSSDIMEAVDLSGYDVDQVEKLYEKTLSPACAACGAGGERLH